MLKKRYISFFNKFEIGQFNTYFKTKTRLKLMSFYNKFKKLFIGQSNLKISFHELSRIWNTKMKRENRKTVTFKTISNWINQLVKAKLVIKVISKSDVEGNSYMLNIDGKYCFLQENLQENLQDELCAKTVETTSLTELEVEPKCLNTNIIDIDSNTSILVPNAVAIIPPVHLNFKKYIEKCSYSYAMETMLNVFKALKVKSNFIKSIVIAKVEKYYWNISKCGAVQYIATLISQAQAQSKKNFREKCLYNSTTKTSTFNDYPQRKYNFNAIENMMLGEMEYDPERLYY